MPGLPLAQILAARRAAAQQGGILGLGTIGQRLAQGRVAQGILSGLTFPGDVYSGRQSVLNEAGDVTPEAIARARDTASIAMSGARGGIAPQGAITSGLFRSEGLEQVPNVAQFDLPRYMPPRGVPARVTELTSNQDVRDKVMSAMQAGQPVGMKWYNNDPVRERFMQELGPERGDQAFRKYMDFVAATSPRSKAEINARNATFYYGKWLNGEPMPVVGSENPPPYGHFAARTMHQPNAQKVAGPGWDPLQNPKPASFVENLSGNQQPATVDTHAFRLPAILARDPRFLETAYQSVKGGPKRNIMKEVESGRLSMEDAARTPAFWQAQPKNTEYGHMEGYYKGIARDMKMSTAQAQAAAWVGGGPMTGLATDATKTFPEILESRVMLTALQRNEDPQDVLRRFIRDGVPILSGDRTGALAVLPSVTGDRQRRRSRGR